MTADAALGRLAQLAGVFDAFTDMQGVVHKTLPDTQCALLAANGYAVATTAEVADSLSEFEATARAAIVPQDVVIIADRAQDVAVGGPATWQVLAEDTSDLLAEGRAETTISLPALPMGVHTLRVTQGSHVQVANLIAAPTHVPSLQDITGQQRTWGVVGALYGLMSDAHNTLGDFNDLAELARILGGQRAGFLGINPVHALGCAAKDTISPYSPTHRGFLNTDHIALDVHAPAAGGDLLSYAAHRQAHNATLAQDFAGFEAQADKAAFAAFCDAGGARLDDFARFEVLSEIHGPDHRTWPAATGQADPARVRYHKWMQWRADVQLGAAQTGAKASGMALGLYLDLAVGARVGGAESWGAQAAAAKGVTLGAPPDHLSPAGQNWQLAALAPRKLQAGRYDALRFVLRQNMRHCGLLRIDHALGLSRSFWLPECGAPGGYITQPFQSLMAVIAIEAQRAGTVIVGEDLGLVPAGFRDEMMARGLYGYSVLQYEKDNKGRLLPPDTLRPQSLACFGTHDTPTLAGFWCGRDIEWWQKLGWIGGKDVTRARRQRTAEKRALSGIKAPDPLPVRATADLRDDVHTALAASPAALAAVQLDDILLLSDAQNLPGTIDAHPNWRRRYPVTLTDIAQSADVSKTAQIMASSGRASQTRKEAT